MTQLQLPPQRPHQHKWQMNFQVGFLMNCPMQLGLSDTTCPQRMQEQNPVKVVFVLYDSEPNRSCSRLCPLFLLVIVANACHSIRCQSCTKIAGRRYNQVPIAPLIHGSSIDGGKHRRTSIFGARQES
jgi:hypothetical protein